MSVQCTVYCLPSGDFPSDGSAAWVRVSADAKRGTGGVATRSGSLCDGCAHRSVLFEVTCVRFNVVLLEGKEIEVIQMMSCLLL